MKRSPMLWALLLTLLLVALGCGGGGGGVAPQNVILSGEVLWLPTGNGTVPAATVRAAQANTTTQTDGFFSLTVPPGTTSLTVTYAPTGGGAPIVRTFSFAAVTADADLGQLYIAPETTVVTGLVQDSTSGAPVVGATVRLAGRSALTGTDGRFTLNDVAYSGTSQAVFFGLQGSVTATGYFATSFSPLTAPVGGATDVGTLSLVPQGGNTPPPAPFNVSGRVLNNGAGATVVAKVGASVIRTVTADATGNYRLWLPAGTFDLEASLGGRTGSATVTVTSPNVPVSRDITLN